MNKILRKKDGLSIVEVLIVLVISGIVIALAVSLQFFGLRSYSMGTSQAEVQQNARIIDEVIRREIRNATAIGNGDEQFNFSSNTLTFANASFELDGISSISFVRKDSSTLQYTITGRGYQLVNEIFLNNVSIPSGIDLSLPLSYQPPG